jgi:uncharacterized repeat protein (TIGR03803 family)
MKTRPGFCGRLIVLALVAAASVLAAAQKETVGHRFQGGFQDGANPEGGVIFDAKGNLYGTTFMGGADGGLGGTVFQVGASGEKILWSFGVAGNDGNNPEGNLIFDSQGNLYGTTHEGQLANAGVVFELSPPSVADGAWTETVLYVFGGFPDGASPAAGLVLDSAGNLYGTTESGGSSNNGTVFELSPPSSSGGAWTETVLYSFAGGNDGSDPRASLIFDGLGNLYGTTYAGGNGAGTVFQLSPPSSQGGPWTETVLYRFGNHPGDGKNPTGPLLMGKSGALYGTTVSGAVFELALLKGTWREGVIHVFGGTDGGNPYGGLIAVGPALLGTTGEGGPGGYGTVFELDPSNMGRQWTVKVLYGFKNGTDGGAPRAGLTIYGGALYGTTSIGGNASGMGTVFKVVR